MPAPIVVGVDPLEREAACDALMLGGRLASELGGTLQAVHVFPPSEGDMRRQRQLHERTLLTLLEAARTTGAATAFAGTSPAFVLHDLAARERGACVVIGSGHGGRRGRTSLGPVAEALLHGSMVPVVVAPRGYASRCGMLDRIGIAYGGTPESDEALRQARELAELAGARLSVLAAEDDTAEALAAASDDLDLDLLVVGSRSYGPRRIVLLSAFTRRLLEAASCPVMIVSRLPDVAHDVALVGDRVVALDV